jgi:hypothetical protein
MKVLVNENGSVQSYTLIGELVNGVEASEPEDLAHFEAHFEAYSLESGALVYQAERDAVLAQEKAAAEIKARREKECFPIINRGQLWYDRLTEAQKTELASWYQAWLDAPETLIVPEVPTWL